MKLKYLLLPFCLLAFSVFAEADEDLLLSHNRSTGAFKLAWWGEDTHAYFVRFSSDLVSGWYYLPVIERGSDETIAYGFVISGDADRGFFHLRHTDLLGGTDPYMAAFADGIPVGWKLENGLDPFADLTGLSPAGSVLTYWELWQLSLDGGNDPADANVAGLVVYTP